MIEISVKGMGRMENVPVTEDMLKNTMGAVQTAIQFGQAVWLEYISGVNVQWTGGSFVVNRVSGNYQQAVMNGIRYPYNSNPLWGAVEVNLDYANIIERGISTFAMKDKILKGRPYVNVPFEHNLTNAPKSITSSISGGRLRNIRIGQNGNFKTFNVGQRSKLTPQELGMRPYSWKTGLYAGMANRGGGSYMTFRRISQNTPDSAWIFPSTHPKPVSMAVESNITEKVNAMITAGFEADMAEATS